MGHSLWLVCVVLAVAAPAAEAASVTVQKLDGSSRSFPLSELPRDVDRGYVVRDSGGERTVAVKGTSLSTLLREADADLVGAGSIEISGGAAQTVLDPDQLSGGGGGSPAVFADGADAAFLRPAYSSDDRNGDDRVAAPSLTVKVRRGTLLEVSARASDTTVAVGKPVTFTASARGGAGQSFVYRWTFDDGSRRGQGARVTHRFREPGSYNVLVSAVTAANQTGASKLVRVRVGPAPKGPDRQGGGTDRSAGAPDSGTAAGGSSGTSGGTGKAAAGPARSAQKSARRSRDVPAGTEIAGTLLGDATEQPTRPAARKRAARAGNDAGAGSRFGLPTEAWGGLAALALVGAGAAAELRPRPRSRVA